ncbi:glycoside hydrolase family 43 protein [Streptomyces zingiberis]|uniref:Alpha-L-arabinofuranosidase n=1 Tax=Streptomyces zingiberis TaxID=2053010 RepID=A0ABX1BPM4_9ACTN|nr:glycoside hydrolase family 43 protein [Streptomyces zingiberis]NJP99675.1 alpha-L-arabinofuranosidase [Streptomyces zingiberis]
MSSRRTFLSWGAASLAAATAGVPAAAGRAAAAEPYGGYVMGYFTESPSQLGAVYALHLAVSRDGLNWVPLNGNNPVATPTAGTGGLRDPYIMRKQDGTFIVLATDLYGLDFGRNNQYIHAWDSTDLRAFTGYRRLKLHDKQAHTWAPEAFWDASRGQYGIVFSGNIDGYQAFWVNYTSDFVNVSAPQLFFHPGYDVLDATLHISAAGNYLYYKNLTNGRLYGARSATLQPRSFDNGTYTAGVVSGAIEAPIVTKDNTRNQWYLWGDSFSPNNAELEVWTSNDISRDAWSRVGKFSYTQPLNAKHATICPITTAEHDNLVARWGTPSWRRVRSYNEPDRFIRHQNSAARIDAYPFDPYPESQWRLVAGLADPAGVSFEAVSAPGSFLRHSGYALRLDRNDGSAGFAGDATFHRAAGLADASWTSFRSHNYPSRYLRHANYVLRIDEIGAGSPAGDRADATFQITY